MYLLDVSRTGGAGGLSSSSDILHLLLSLCCQSIFRGCVSDILFRNEIIHSDAFQSSIDSLIFYSFRN